MDLPYINDIGHWLAAAFVSATAGLLLFALVRRSKDNEARFSLQENGRKLGRVMSFTSASMAIGAFPIHTQMADHIINAAIFFESEDCPELKDVVEIVKIFLQYERCSGIPTEVRKNVWRCKECQGIDPTKLVRTIEMEGSAEETYTIIGDHMQDPLVEGRGDLPWWEFLLINNSGPGMSACVLRMHHCIGDGLSIVNLLEHFIKYVDGTPARDLIPKSMSNKFKVEGNKISMMVNSVKAAIKVITQPASAFDDDTIFSKDIGKDMIYTGRRKCVVFNTVPLSFIKELKNAGSVSVNDILFTCLSEAIHKYNVEQKCSVTEKKGINVQCRALVPVGFPRPAKETNDKSQTMRNKWVFVSSDMGVGISNIMDRLDFVHSHLKSIKNSPLAYIQLLIQETIPPKLPLTLARQTVFDLFCRHTLVFSNVPGPNCQCSFAGKKAIGTQMFYNNLIPQVGIISYNGNVFMNMVLDPVAIRNCERLPILYSRALIALAENLGVDTPQCVSNHAKMN